MRRTNAVEVSIQDVIPVSTVIPSDAQPSNGVAKTMAKNQIILNAFFRIILLLSRETLAFLRQLLCQEDSGRGFVLDESMRSGESQWEFLHKCIENYKYVSFIALKNAKKATEVGWDTEAISEKISEVKCRCDDNHCRRNELERFSNSLS